MEELFQHDWFLLLITIAIPMVIGLAWLAIYSAKRKRVTRGSDGIVFHPSGFVKVAYVAGIAALLAFGATNLFSRHAWEAIAGLVAAAEMARWFPSTIRMNQDAIVWRSPFQQGSMRWEEITAVQKKPSYPGDEGYVVHGSSGQRLIVERSAHPDVKNLIRAIAGEIKRRNLIPTGALQSDTIEWLHRALATASISAILISRTHWHR